MKTDPDSVFSSFAGKVRGFYKRVKNLFRDFGKGTKRLLTPMDPIEDILEEGAVYVISPDPIIDDPIGNDFTKYYLAANWLSREEVAAAKNSSNFRQVLFGKRMADTN